MCRDSFHKSSPTILKQHHETNDLMTNKSTLIILLITSFLGGISLGQTTVNYLESAIDFANPERGFYRYSSTHSDNYTLLDSTTLAGYREPHVPFGADYTIYSTLVFRYFYLDEFTNDSIRQGYLDSMQMDFSTARSAGVKLIPRFAYTNNVDGSGCPSWICPPYGDAPKSWVLTHISQVAPILEMNKDVVACLQMGWIGVWGENYYTDYFGDASQAPNYKLEDTNWADRIEVLNAFLSAVPVERMVQVRYPQMKQRTIYGLNALTDVAALTAGEAYTQSDKARIGFHNDCFLSSDNDFGTYNDYGNTSSPSLSDTNNLKPYVEQESRFVVVGGETCNDGYSPENDCIGTHPSARADSELERLHYSFLNSQYNNDVNNDWETAGCMEQIKRRLGYRFVLQSGSYTSSAQPGQVMNISLSIKNKGYAAPFNERNVELILRNTSNQEEWFVPLTEDPRFWLADGATYSINADICIPENIPLGNYELFLNLPDPMISLKGNPSFSIRLANTLLDLSDVWESSTGYNHLGHTITIDNSSANADCNGEISLEYLSVNSNIILETQNILLIPNPCDQFFSITDNNHNIKKISAYSLFGKEVPISKVDQGKYDIQNLESGIYLIEIHFEHFIIVRRLVKK